MKKAKFNLATMQGKLSRIEMKNIKGGDEEEDPNGGGGGYKCCWINDPTNCSDCVPGGRPSCVATAKAVAC